MSASRRLVPLLALGVLTADRLRPILPCYRKVFAAVEAWIGPQRVSPPASGTIPVDRCRDVVNSC